MFLDWHPPCIKLAVFEAPDATPVVPIVVVSVQTPGIGVHVVRVVRAIRGTRPPAAVGALIVQSPVRIAVAREPTVSSVITYFVTRHYHAPSHLLFLALQ